LSKDNLQYIGNIHWNTSFENFYWEKFKLNIVADGFTEWGMRVHIVSEEHPPSIKDNALVMSRGYLTL